MYVYWTQASRNSLGFTLVWGVFHVRLLDAGFWNSLGFTLVWGVFHVRLLDAGFWNSLGFTLVWGVFHVRLLDAGFWNSLGFTLVWVGIFCASIERTLLQRSVVCCHSKPVHARLSVCKAFHIIILNISPLKVNIK